MRVEPGRLKRDLLQILLLTLLFWLVFGLVYLQQIGQQARERGAAETAALAIGQREIQEDLSRAILDLRSLVQHHVLLGARYPLTGNDLTTLEHRFMVLARESRIYDQIRLLDDLGVERIRVNWDGAAASLVPVSALQDKSNRYYFRDSIVLAADQVYVSPFDLNIEHGQIERPFKPMLRFATPAFASDGTRLGVVVLNYLGQRLLRRFVDAVGDIADHAVMLNAEGFWLRAAHPEDEWGFMLPHGRSFGQRYPQAWDRIANEDAGQFHAGGDLFTFMTLYPLGRKPDAGGSLADPGASGVSLVQPHDYYWKLVSRVPAQTISGENRHLMMTYLRLALPLYLALVFSSVAVIHLRNRGRSAESALALSGRSMRAMVENAMDAILTLDADGRVTRINPSAQRLFGHERADDDDDAVLFMEQLLPEQWRPRFQEILRAALDAEPGSKGERLELRMSTPNGREFDAELTLSPVHFDNTRRVGVFVRDISERKRMEENLRENRDLLERQVAERTRELTEEITERKRAEIKLRQAAKVFENTRDAIVITDDSHRVTACNPAFTAITGFSEAQLRGRTPWFFESSDTGVDVRREVHSLGSWQGELSALREDGSSFPVWLSVSAVRNPYGRISNYVAVFSDITEIKRSQARLDFLAHHDALTQLPNRVMFTSLLDNAILRARRTGQCLAVLFVDLDRFKNVNDSLGHDAGDELLRVIAGRLRAALREADTLARMGGDEFTVLLDAPQTREEAGLVARKLISAVRAPVNLRGTEVFVGASIGISLYPDDGDSVDTLLRNADVAMFSAKQSGRDRFRYSTAELSAAAGSRAGMERDLRGARLRREFELYLQPQRNLATGEVAGAEALLRWHHPERGLLLPGQFLELAEETGLIRPIGEWVLRSACEVLADWREQGFGNLCLSVNISARQLRDKRLVDMLVALQREYELVSDRLELDLSEASLQDLGKGALSLLERLRVAGVRLAVDDFGSACSGLSELRRLRLDRLKLTPEIISDLSNSAQAQGIVRSIVGLAHSLEMSVLAKGVEFEGQLRILRDENCEQGQGVLLGKPMVPEEFQRLLVEAGR